MPIRPELRPLHSKDWPELSRRVRFERAGGNASGADAAAWDGTAMSAGRWFDPREATWRDRRARAAGWPDLDEMTRQRTTRVILAAAHVNHDPTRSGQRNLRSLGQRCPRATTGPGTAAALDQLSAALRACGSVPGAVTSTAVLLAEIFERIAARLSYHRETEPRRAISSGAFAHPLLV